MGYVHTFIHTGRMPPSQAGTPSASDDDDDDDDDDDSDSHTTSSSLSSSSSSLSTSTRIRGRRGRSRKASSLHTSPLHHHHHHHPHHPPTEGGRIPHKDDRLKGVVSRAMLVGWMMMILPTLNLFWGSQQSSFLMPMLPAMGI